MEKKTLKISIKPIKLMLYLLLVCVFVAIFFFAKTSQKNESLKTNKDTKEIIMPRETGVADPGFELSGESLSALNAKVSLDTLEAINGKQSLKIFFSPSSKTSVKIRDYINDIAKDGYYRLSFWARTDADDNKTVHASLSGKDETQTLGDFSFNDNSGVRFFEFNFQSANYFSDLVLTSTDGKSANVWIDDVLVEKLNVESVQQLKELKPTVFGNTSRFNIEQSLLGENGDSGDFFASPNRKLGQIYQPSLDLISSVTLKIQKRGTGGAGDYHFQIREYDEKLGIISDEVIATRKIYTDYPASFLDQIKEKQQLMKEEFDQNETDIKEGRVPNDQTIDQYPTDYTQQQIDDSKAKKRAGRFALSITEMEESFNVPYELNIPITVKLDKSKKYWIGIDNTDVKVDRRNYIKVFFSGNAGSSVNSGLLSTEQGIWEENKPLWLKTLYPEHAQFQGNDILSGATISDYGDKLIYRYQFNDDDYSALSGFPGRKIYDMLGSDFKQSNDFGNYSLSQNQYAIYRFNTIYPINKITIRSGNYNQSLAVNFSSNGEDWKEVFSDDPEEDGQKLSPLTINPDIKNNEFYLKLSSAGSSAVLSQLDLEAELEK